MVHCDDLGRANKGEIEWPEEKDDMLATEIRQFESIVDAAVGHGGGGGKIRGFSGD